MKLIIAEKPDLARDIAHAVCGAPERCRLPYEGNGYRVVACAGHLLRLAEPRDIDPERWGKRSDLTALPILAKPWPKQVAPGKEALLAEIEHSLTLVDGVVNAGDPDDEGQLLIDEVLDYLGYTGPVERVYVNDNLPENIRRAFDHLIDNEQARADGDAALARSLADFTFGVNESRLITARAGYGKSISVGRVKTPTLGLVVARDEEIEGHKSRDYYTGAARVLIDGHEFEFEFKPNKDLLDDEGKRCTDRAALLDALNEAAGQTGTLTTRLTHKLTPAPLPYNLTDLTADVCERYKMSAKQVLDATQTLRETHHAITYNRSDCNYLPTAAHAEAPAVLGRAQKNLGVEWNLDFDLQGRCFDDSAITAHTAIIPQAKRVTLSQLTNIEKRVYVAIVERYGMQFAGDAEDDVSESEISLPQGKLIYRAVRETCPGWRKIRRTEERESRLFLEAGPHRYEIASVSTQKKKTRPRPRYTEATLVKDMASIAKYVTDSQVKEVLLAKDAGKRGEHGGIGTSATRAKIIEELKDLDYLKADQGKLVSTDLGRAVYHAVPEDIRGADMTARWWLMQEEVRAGTADPYVVAESVCETFRAHKDTAYLNLQIDRNANYPKVGRCPKCGAAVIDKGNKSYLCTTNRWKKGEDGSWQLVGGCGYRQYKVICGHTLTPAEMGRILEDGRSELVRGFTSKKGKRFDAYLVLQDDASLAFEFPPRR